MKTKKTTKSTLQMETLKDRNMLSASPLSNVAAPGPVIAPRWNTIAVPVVEETDASSGSNGEGFNDGQLIIQANGTAGAYLEYKLENVFVPSAHGK